MKRSLPQTSSLEHLKKEAKDLLVGHRQQVRTALEALSQLPKFRDTSLQAIAGTKASLARVAPRAGRRFKSSRPESHRPDESASRLPRWFRALTMVPGAMAIVPALVCLVFFFCS